VKRAPFSSLFTLLVIRSESERERPFSAEGRREFFQRRRGEEPLFSLFLSEKRGIQLGMAHWCCNSRGNARKRATRPLRLPHPSLSLAPKREFFSSTFAALVTLLPIHFLSPALKRRARRRGAFPQAPNCSGLVKKIPFRFPVGNSAEELSPPQPLKAP